MATSHTAEELVEIFTFSIGCAPPRFMSRYMLAGAAIFFGGQHPFEQLWRAFDQVRPEHEAAWYAAAAIVEDVIAADPRFSYEPIPERCPAVAGEFLIGGAA